MPRSARLAHDIRVDWLGGASLVSRAEVLIVARDADAFAAELASIGGAAIPHAVARSAEEALARYAGQTVLFGEPALIAAVLPAMPSVKWVQSSWAGVLPLLQLERRDFLLTGVKRVFDAQMAEYVFGYLLAHELRIFERDEQQRLQRWDETASGTLRNRTLGVLGTGSIGRHIARVAAAFELRVVGCSRSGASRAEFAQVVPVDRLDAFLSRLDFLVAVLPETPATDHLLDARALALLPRHAYLINVGRGNLIDEAALSAALHAGALAGAALDVFHSEPLPADSLLWTTPRLRITGHVAARSHAADIVPIFVDNYRRFASGEPLEYAIDFEKGY